MTWDALLPVIIQNGLLVAEKLWQLWSKGDAPTQEEWDALKALGKENSKSQMILALTRNGIDPESDKGKALLALLT